MNNLFNTSPRTVGDIVSKSEVFAIGDGLYSEEFYDFNNEFLFEVVGENGTRCTIEEMEYDSQRVDRVKKLYFNTLLPLNERINLRGGIGVGEPYEEPDMNQLELEWEDEQYQSYCANGWFTGDDGQLYQDYEESIGE
jgi:hypothetical protein